MLSPFVFASMAAIVSAKALAIPAEERAVLLADLAAWEKEFGNPWDRNMDYTSQDDLLRRMKDAKAQAAVLSAKNPHAEFSHLTKYALQTDAEFKAKLLGSTERGPLDGQASIAQLQQLDGAPAVANGTIDWSTTACVNPVKDQGSCGGCWTFAAVGVAESAHCIATGTLLDLSEQQVVSCDKLDGGNGCNGGYAAPAINWIVKNNGVCLTKDYPFTSGVTEADGECKTTCDVQKLAIGDHVSIKGEAALTLALNKQPVAVRVYAGVWRMYKRGILTDCDSTADEYGHAVIAVGYGTHNGVDYYKIRNSWGANWGEQGYIRLERNVGFDGTCNVAGAPSFPQIL